MVKTILRGRIDLRGELMSTEWSFWNMLLKNTNVQNCGIDETLTLIYTFPFPQTPPVAPEIALKVSVTSSDVLLRSRLTAQHFPSPRRCGDGMKIAGPACRALRGQA